MSFFTVRLLADAVELLDQRRLPGEELYLRLGDGEAVARAIEDMAVRGAPAIGVTAAMGVALELGRAPDAGALADPGADQRPARPHPADGGEPALGARAHGARARRPARGGRRPPGVRAAAREVGAAHRTTRTSRAVARSATSAPRSCRRTRACSPTATPARSRPPATAPALGVVRSAARATASCAARGGAGDAPVPAGRAAHGLGAQPGRHSGHGSSPTRWAGRCMAQGPGGPGDRSAPTGSRRTATSRTRSAPTPWRSLARAHRIPFYVAAPFSTVDLSLARRPRDPDRGAQLRRGDHTSPDTRSPRRA